MIAFARAALCCALLAGPFGARAGAADLSVLPKWTGKEPFARVVGGKSLWDQPGVQASMRAAMGGPYFTLARKAMLSGPQTPVATNGAGIFVAWSCKAHDCGDNQVSVFFDSGSGTTQACLRVSDRSGRVQDVWLAEGQAHPLAADACLSTGDDPFALLKKFATTH